MELDISNTASNLLSRDADIAVRMFRPVQNDLVARKIASLPLGFFGHEDYFATAGRPASAADLTDHRLIGFDRDPALIAAAKALGLDLTPRQLRIPLRYDPRPDRSDPGGLGHRDHTYRHGYQMGGCHASSG